MDTVAKFNPLDDNHGALTPADQQEHPQTQQTKQTGNPSILAKEVVSFNSNAIHHDDIKEPCDQSLAALEPLDLTLDAILSAQLDAEQQYQLDRLHRQLAKWVFDSNRSLAMEQHIEQAFKQIDTLMSYAYESLCAAGKAKVNALQAKIDALYQGDFEPLNPALGFYSV